MSEYSTQNYSVDIDSADYIRRFRRPEIFIEACKRCPNYGRVWACPPFDNDPADAMYRYKRAKIMVTKVIPADRGLPIDSAQQLILPERRRIESQLLDTEQSTGGRAFAYVGSCLHCNGRACTRPEGRPCRHPELVRPSLEACGFDIGRTLDELFGIELLWGTNGQLPPYLVIVSALFY